MNDAGPRQVLLFSGHMVDAPGRTPPRFPPSKVPAADAAIRRALAELNAGPGDTALCGGACGGDLLFAAACLARAVPVTLHLPAHEAEFLAESVDHGGPGWRERYQRVTKHTLARTLVLTEVEGLTQGGESKHARNNLWMLREAQAWGADRVRFLCLWDGRGGDGPGGTEHMYRSVTSAGGQARVINITSLPATEAGV